MRSTVNTNGTSSLRLAAALGLALVLISPALADDVKVVSTPAYADSQVTGLSGLLLSFTTSSGSRISKDLSEVELILIAGQDAFNRAEKEYADGAYAKAIASYTAAMDKAGNDWMKKLVTMRRLRALSRNGPIDQAVRDWLPALAESGKAAATVSLVPQRLGAKGSNVNANAIKALETAAEKATGDKARTAELAEIQKLLLRLYETEGQKEKAEKLLSSGVSMEEDSGSLNASDAAATLRDAEKLLASQPAEALTTIRRRINSFTANDLPKALMISGRAQQAMAAKAEGEERQKLLAAAGLDFMRIAVFFPGGETANEALLQAGHCCRDVGNLNAARAAYKVLIDYFTETKQAAEARDALQRL